MLRRLPVLVLRRGPVRDGPARAAAGAATSRRGIASASRLSAATREQRREVGARPQPVHVRLAGARRRRRAASARRPRVSWTWISPRRRRRADRRTSGAAPSGSTTARLADADPSRGAEHDPPRGAVEQAPGARPIAAVRPSARCSSGGTSGADGRAVAEERGAAQPQPQGVPVDQRDRPVGHAAGSARASAAAIGRSAGARRRTRLVLSSGAPSWRSAIARRRPSGSSRTWTE